MHTYNTNPPTSVKQHLQHWLSKCCTNLLTKELKHLCTRTQLNVKANYVLHALTPTENIYFLFEHWDCNDLGDLLFCVLFSQ